MGQREATIETEWYRCTNEETRAYGKETSNSEEWTGPSHPQ
jgi:hypothetical protein